MRTSADCQKNAFQVAGFVMRDVSTRLSAAATIRSDTESCRELLGVKMRAVGPSVRSIAQA